MNVRLPVENSVNLVHMMAEKAQEIFQLFDQEKKGFITKKDLLHLQNELPQTPEQLEMVFDSLDKNGNGYLTLDEFTHGFGGFLGLPDSSSLTSEVYEDEDDSNDSQTESREFDKMIQHIGAFGLLQDVSVIKSLWIRLHNNHPEMIENFEDFLRRITSELKRTHMNYKALQSAMENKRFAHDEEIRNLYVEMESQLNAEKERIQAEEKAKEKLLRENMEMELLEKDKRLQELIVYQKEMENRLMKLNAHEAHAKHENEMLLKEKEEMEEMLDSSHQDLEESKNRIAEMQKLQREKKREGSLAAAQISEWIMLERESLLRQLQELKNLNRKLQDSHDEMERKHQTTHHTSQKNRLDRNQKRTSTGSSATKNHLMGQISCDEPDNVSYINGPSKEYDKNDADELNRMLQGYRLQPIGSSDNSESLTEKRVDVVAKSNNPERLYKIVFVGDSGVGKSSFIYRICKKSFISSFSATIGVDFQVHSVTVDNQLVVLQLWDTAGQERFRSITKQYFRKADGVLVMYDVTSEPSFRSVRDWLNSIKETVDEETVLLLIGNKSDMIEENQSINKVINRKHGEKLADEFAALFFETSAKSGLNVQESIEQMSRLLRDREDKKIERLHAISTCTLTQIPSSGARKERKCCDF